MKLGIISVSLMMLAASFSYADDFDDWGDFGDASASGDAMSFASVPEPAVTVGGVAKLATRYQLESPEDADAKDKTLTSAPVGKISAKYSNDTTDAEILLNFSESSLKNKEDVIEELTVRGYFGNLKLEVGKMKVVWGKGDTLHVIDNINADDYTNFIYPDYIERRLGVSMFRASYSVPSKSNLRLEAVFTPGMTPDRYAESGIWTPAQMDEISSVVKGVVSNQIAGAGSDVTKILQYASFDSSSLYPDTKKLDYSQAGLRLTGTGRIDWGLSYYYGRNHKPSYNLDDYISSSIANGGLGKSTVMPVLDYDRKQTFGIETAFVLWHFNLRGEACYNLTEDTAGDDPWIHNNSVQYLAGFDIDLPIHNINVNVQETGTYILNGSKVDDGEGFASYGALKSTLRNYDVDYDKKGYTNNKLVVNITDSFMNDKICPEITALWGIERNDLVLKPMIKYKPNGNLSFILGGLYIHSDDKDSEFYEWRKNSFVNLAVVCKF